MFPKEFNINYLPEGCVLVDVTFFFIQKDQSGDGLIKPLVESSVNVLLILI